MCIHSWTYVHNETGKRQRILILISLAILRKVTCKQGSYLPDSTVNIYSHIIGACIFLSLPLYFFTTEVPPRYAIATWSDIVVCSTYFLGVATCFVLSTA